MNHFDPLRDFLFFQINDYVILINLFIILIISIFEPITNNESSQKFWKWAKCVVKAHLALKTLSTKRTFAKFKPLLIFVTYLIGEKILRVRSLLENLIWKAFVIVAKNLNGLRVICTLTVSVSNNRFYIQFFIQVDLLRTPPLHKFLKIAPDLISEMTSFQSLDMYQFRETRDWNLYFSQLRQLYKINLWSAHS